MKTKITCCLNCPNRFYLCHESCVKYKGEVKELEEYKDLRAKDKEQNTFSQARCRTIFKISENSNRKKAKGY